jgi:hypothetical protein
MPSSSSTSCPFPPPSTSRLREALPSFLTAGRMTRLNDSPPNTARPSRPAAARAATPSLRSPSVRFLREPAWCCHRPTAAHSPSPRPSRSGPRAFEIRRQSPRPPPVTAGASPSYQPENSGPTRHCGPASEDLIGAGAVLADLPGTPSPEAELAIAAFARFRHDLAGALSRCGSGRELIERGFTGDVELAAEYAVSQVAPRLTQGQFT